MTQNTYEVQFTTTSDFYRKKMLPFNEHIKQVFAENKTQATERAYQKLLRDFPNCSQNIWEVKKIIRRDTNIFGRIFV